MQYTLRNGEVVEVDVGMSDRTSTAIWHNGIIQHLLNPETPEGMITYPVGGVLGRDFDVIAVHGTEYDDLFDLRIGRHNLNLKNGEIDLMNTNKPAFQTIEYYHNTDVGNMSDDQIFGYVRNIDAKLKELVGLGDGKAVTAHRVRLETEKEGLLRVVDARYEKEAPADNGGGE
jgi:hypothetical protein